jgi:histone H3/H4
MSANVREGHRFKRTPVFKPHLAVHPGGAKLKPGKLAAQESAYLRTAGGVDVPRAPAMRVAKKAIAETVPIISAENRRFSRRLALRGKHVPASLTVAPAHQWNVADEALDHIMALIDLTAKNLAKGAHRIADADRRKTILPEDVRMVTALRQEWGI